MRKLSHVKHWEVLRLTKYSFVIIVFLFRGFVTRLLKRIVYFVQSYVREF
jgi:hypothetical protein